MAKELKTIQQFEEIRSELIAKNEFSCNPKLFSASNEWGIHGGVIARRDGNFFSITGLRVYSSKDPTPLYEGPIIFQPTNAINGFLYEYDNNVLHILFQARVEPGNTGIVQLAPTVQSTEANYKQLHGGKPTSYINNFLHCEKCRVLYRGLQSEEGSRYHGKYNLYIITEAGEYDFSKNMNDFFLLSAEEIKKFISIDNIINTDARGLLVFLDWEMLSGNSKAFDSASTPINRALMKSYYYSDDKLGTGIFQSIQQLMHTRAHSAMRAEHISIDKLSNWKLNDEYLVEINKQLGFSVSLYDVQAINREVPQWDQPMISSDTEGRVVLFCRINDGVMEFLISLDRDIGYLEGTQYTSSISIAPGKRDKLCTEAELLLLEEANGACSSDIMIECRQSEEGGRFFHDINHYRIILTEKDFSLSVDPKSKWMTLSQIRNLGKISSMLSIELRCVLALLIKLV